MLLPIRWPCSPEPEPYICDEEEEEDISIELEEEGESMALPTTSCPCGNLRKDSLYSSMGECESTAQEMLYLKVESG